MAEGERIEPAGGSAAQPGKQKKLSLRRAFFTGLAALMPTALTLVILVWVLQLIHRTFAEPINKLAITIINVFLSGDWAAAEKFFRAKEGQGWVDFTFAGDVVAVLLILVVGVALLTFVGRQLYTFGERLISNLPVMKMVYPHVKQLTQFIFSEKKTSAFGRVVAFEYPRQGLWSLGFVTGPGLPGLSEHAGKEIVTVFVPSSPTPFTGYVVSVPKEEIVELSVSADDALRFVMSGGVLAPRKPGPELGAASRPPGGSSADAPRA